jgi:hypothetical protein
MFELLMTLAFFAPMAAMVAMALACYRDERYTLQPRAPRIVTRDPSPVEEEAYELRKAA